MSRRVVPFIALGLLAGCGHAAETSSGTVATPTPPVSTPSSAHPGSRCPAEGVRLELDEGDAAMGLRVRGITLVNCGSRTYRLNGYPVVRALDEDRAPLDLQVLQGVTEIVGSSMPWDGPPRPVTLGPGQRASAAVAWRNTYDDIRKPPVDATFLRIEPLAGRPAQTVEADLDLGSTGRFGISPWVAVPDTTAAPASSPPAPAPSDPVASDIPLP
ncbi:Putative membrane protein mmpL3 [Actinoplanes sp. SE50]|uniref:DUF4232 domain-containing protein n=1 Tax=unclassified Actinoplanes TaxID=2626549 RepID=UPI00023ED2F5|nr:MULTISPECIES: DUF4232 domain-containing protein [unclassified Actinoplanes]AEV87289.1 Putative membrane protein mmpL3 [Actinoplanes sp. SE50/110]ATO85689.1 Putative membrane protein mmpL3 [Actinoplanes sp. SE50]SLM03102.1 hypothetical protein ACSP50_6391 [Actinoplanes sp. SE50/110]